VDAAPTLDASWLAMQLRRCGYPAAFEAIEYEAIGRFSTDVWRLRVISDSPDAHPSLIVKRPYQASRTGEPAALESMFYQRVSHALPVPAPSFVGLYQDCLVITELLGLQPFDFLAGAQAHHGSLAMEGLAAIHASRWNEVSDLEWIPNLGDPELRRAWQADFDMHWKRNRSGFHELCPRFTPIGDALVGRLANTLEPLAHPQTLLHGDAHGENLPVSSDGRVVFLDWQSPRIGNPGFDTAVFTSMSYPVEARRREEEALLERHVESLKARGLDWPDPWMDYRRGLLRRAARIVEISGDSGFSSLSFVFQRCASAAADHRVLDLIL